MGTGMRIFFVNDDDSLRRFPVARYKRLHRREPDECLPEYAGEKVRRVMVVLGIVNRKPESVIYVDYSLISFDENGRVDISDFEREARLVGELVESYLPKPRGGPVIDARSRFAKKRLMNEFKWTPTAEIEEAIVSAIFGREE